HGTSTATVTTATVSQGTSRAGNERGPPMACSVTSTHGTSSALALNSDAAPNRTPAATAHCSHRSRFWTNQQQTSAHVTSSVKTGSVATSAVPSTRLGQATHSSDAEAVSRSFPAGQVHGGQGCSFAQRVQNAHDQRHR